MMIDYEAEYDNKARVPDWAAITAAWESDAAAFRAAAGGTLDVAYGESEREKLDIFGDGNGPVALFVHGGYWRSRDRKDFSHLSAGALAHGVTFVLPSYDLCPAVDVGTIVAQVRRAAAFTVRRFGRPIAVAGHSAGGHLAACLLATDWSAQGAGLPGSPMRSALAISGLFDLAPMLHTSLNADLRLDEETAGALSPALWPAPRGLVLDAVVGGEESGDFKRQSRLVAERWGAGGAQARYVEEEGANHFTVVAPLADPASALTLRLVDLARSACT